ncbi:MAG: hypothetical protein QF460_02860, partial [Candidatus Nanoarchaeia archaeon]|nr:hypothetical protein [Candidatus Nanoarchaeia archaeon]
FETFALGQTLNNYLSDSAEISICNAMHSTGSNWIDEPLPEADEINTYFEEIYQDNLAVYIAAFPPIKKTSLEDEYSLYTNLFFHSEFDYENKIIKGGPDKVIYNHAYGYDPEEEESLYETVEFIDYLEILSDDGYIYKLRPIYSVDFPTEFFDRFETARDWTSGTPDGFESIVNEPTEEDVENTISPTGRVIATTDLKCLGKNVQIIFTP